MKAGNTDNVYDEVRVAHAVGKVMPEHFRRPVQVDLDRRWMLMEDYGSPIDREECTTSKDPDLVKDILGEWARIQEASIDVINVLKEEGVPVLGTVGHEQAGDVGKGLEMVRSATE
ncbi:hypothetical protein FGB62_116g013 [Gracilaria domingensis]|nr:hypothetical protein FGB62_116g013 [Gracilaria domingensis]